MANTNFKLFDENKQNMMPDQEYSTNQARLGGVQAGLASSALHNKSMYQQSLMVNAIAQFMVAKGFNANDSDAVSTFNSNLMQALQKLAKDETATDIQDLNSKYENLEKQFINVNESITSLNKVANGTLEFIGKTVGLLANTRNVIQVPNISRYRLLFVYIEDTKIKGAFDGTQDTYVSVNSVGTGVPSASDGYFKLYDNFQSQYEMSSNALIVLYGTYSTPNGTNMSSMFLYPTNVYFSQSYAINKAFNTITNVYVYPESPGGSFLLWGLRQGS